LYKARRFISECYISGGQFFYVQHSAFTGAKGGRGNQRYQQQQQITSSNVHLLPQNQFNAAEAFWLNGCWRINELSGQLG